MLAFQVKKGRIEEGSDEQISIKVFIPVYVGGEARAADDIVTDADIDSARDLLVNPGLAAYVPTLSSIDPATQNDGADDFEMTLVGLNFQSTAKVDANGTILVPTSVTETEIVVTVPASVVATTGNKPFRVRNYSTDPNGIYSDKYAQSGAINLVVS